MNEVDGQISELAPDPPVALVPAPDENQNQNASNFASSSISSASSNDNGLSKRPRDARLLHMILANLGVTAYQERVPLQLMDFAYRYTSSTLQDALHLTSEGYGNLSHPPNTGRGAGSAANNDMSSVTLLSLRLSIASRTHYQFSPTLPKEFYQEIAQERNRIALPVIGRDWGLRLPPEQYCLTGVGWALKEEWDSDGDEASKCEDQNMIDQTIGQDGEEYEAEDGNQRMEDIFGENFDSAEKDEQMDEG